ncbi:hypothetical protein N658DRAFT_48206 [Parathielavia hyrcaniae]|uniref:Uncharacterized protein n=1 Tax=Parathielavia hyrcaniae TaxID=113614 RepID=A0AAN6Q130_9PEZI|nr:hypothetical protein N658DRAFT_48206 [Parathielavia hyrcaniae]
MVRSVRKTKNGVERRVHHCSQRLALSQLFLIFPRERTSSSTDGIRLCESLPLRHRRARACRPASELYCGVGSGGGRCCGILPHATATAKRNPPIAARLFPRFYRVKAHPAVASRPRVANCSQTVISIVTVGLRSAHATQWRRHGQTPTTREMKAPSACLPGTLSTFPQALTGMSLRLQAIVVSAGEQWNTARGRFRMRGQRLCGPLGFRRSLNGPRGKG